jgi:hypothetical protein
MNKRKYHDACPAFLDKVFDKAMLLNTQSMINLLDIYDTNPTIQEVVTFIENDLFSGQFIFDGKINDHLSKLMVDLTKKYLRNRNAVGICAFISKPHPLFGALPCVLDLTLVHIYYQRFLDGDCQYEVRYPPPAGGSVMGELVEGATVVTIHPPTQNGDFRSIVTRLKPEIDSEVIRAQYAQHVDRVRANPMFVLEKEVEVHSGETMKATFAMNTINKHLAPPPDTKGTESRESAEEVKYWENRYRNSEERDNSLAQISSGLKIHQKIELLPGQKLVSQVLPEPPTDYLIQRECLRELIYNQFNLPIGMVSSGGAKTAGKSGGSSETNNLHMFERAQARLVAEIIQMVKEQRGRILYAAGESIEKIQNQVVTLTSIPNELELDKLYYEGSIPFKTYRMYKAGRIPEEQWNSKPAMKLEDIHGIKDEVAKK